MLTSSELNDLLLARPYQQSSTMTILEHLRSGGPYHWEAFEKFFGRGTHTAIVNVLKEEFIEGAKRYIHRWWESQNSPPLIRVSSSDNAFVIPAAYEEVATRARTALGNKFFSTLLNTRLWSRRCIMCGNSNSVPARYEPCVPTEKHLPDFRFILVFLIDAPRYEAIRQEFGFATNERQMLGICTGCQYTCRQCKIPVKQHFDVVEMREFLQTKECLNCGKYSLVKVEHPKPSRNTWKEIARRKDLMP